MLQLGLQFAWLFQDYAMTVPSRLSRRGLVSRGVGSSQHRSRRRGAVQHQQLWGLRWVSRGGRRRPALGSKRWAGPSHLKCHSLVVWWLEETWATGRSVLFGGKCHLAGSLFLSELAAGLWWFWILPTAAAQTVSRKKETKSLAGV